MNKYRSLYNTTLSLIINLLLVMGCFILCRVIFLIENLKAFFRSYCRTNLEDV